MIRLDAGPAHRCKRQATFCCVNSDRGADSAGWLRVQTVRGARLARCSEQLSNTRARTLAM